MTQEKVHVITDAPETTEEKEKTTKKRIKKGAMYGIFAAGALLLVTDVVARLRPTEESTDNVVVMEENPYES